MATPVVTGSLALLLDKDNDLHPKELKSKIMKSCTSLNENPENQGAGIVNVGKLFNDESSKPSRPIRSRRQRRTREQPVSKPVVVPETHSESYVYDIEKQSYMPEALIFLMFLILLLIRII